MEILKYKKELISRVQNMGLSYQIAEDVFQDVCISYIKQDNINNVRQWAHVAVKNRAINVAKSDKLILPGDEWFLLKPSVYEEYIEPNIDTSCLIGSGQRMVIHETINGLSLKQISEKHGISYNTAKSNYRNAVTNLKKSIDNDSQLPFNKLLNTEKP
jgi:DNA-directed RNA polymerase specialized sigma24 family protein